VSRSIRRLAYFAAAALMAIGSYAGAQSAATDYARLCSGCHSDRFRSPATGGTTARSKSDSVAVIRDGIPVKGMPAFGVQLSEPQIEALAQLIQPSGATSPKLGVPVEATSLDEERSSGLRNHVYRTAAADALRWILR
jgi:mono/diheme cytochrome c family protein